MQKPCSTTGSRSWPPWARATRSARISPVPRAAAGSIVLQLQCLAQPLQLLGWAACTVVVQAQTIEAAIMPGTQHDAARLVALGIVEQVEQHGGKQVGIGVQRLVAVDLDAQLGGRQRREQFRTPGRFASVARCRSGTS